MTQAAMHHEMRDRSRTRALLVLYTLIWPGLGHVQQGRTMPALLFILWAGAAAIGILFAPAFSMPRGLFVAELIVIAIIAVVDVLRVKS